MTAPNWTLDQSLNQLLRGSPNLSGVGSVWAGSTITYAFADYYYQLATLLGEDSTFSPLGSAARTQARLTMELWDDLIPQAITEVAPSTRPNFWSQDYALAFGHTLSPNYAYTFLPRTGGSSVWFNPTYNSASGTNDVVTPRIGAHGFVTYIHEIGHALALHHMGDYNGADNDGPSSIQDSSVFTVMSYYGPS